ncbi:MAG TPA: flippase-like domain-containing protein, partial [Phycisphaerae bacterium]|nr:flippase-like domain-containing protein [Phycisphaerae bacterium]
IIARTSPIGIAVSVAVYATAWLLRTCRLRLLTTGSGTKIKIIELFKVYVAGFALNSILPARLGDVATAVLLGTKGLDLGRSAAIVVQSRVLDAFALVAVTVPALTVLLKERTPLWVVTGVLVGMALALVPVVLVILDTRNVGATVLERWGGRVQRKSCARILATARTAYDCYREILSDRPLLLASAVLSLLMMICEGLTCLPIALGACPSNLCRGERQCYNPVRRT